MDGDTFNEPRSKDKRSKRYVVFEVTPRGERSAVGHGYLKEACRLLNKAGGDCQVIVKWLRSPTDSRCIAPYQKHRRLLSIVIERASMERLDIGSLGPAWSSSRRMMA
jgi:hypothetical protein